MKHQRSEETVIVKQGHSLQWDADEELYGCLACSNRYFDANGPAPDDWCAR